MRAAPSTWLGGRDDPEESESEHPVFTSLHIHDSARQDEKVRIEHGGIKE